MTLSRLLRAFSLACLCALLFAPHARAETPTRDRTPAAREPAGLGGRLSPATLSRIVRPTAPAFDDEPSTPADDICAVGAFPLSLTSVAPPAPRLDAGWTRGPCPAARPNSTRRFTSLAPRPPPALA